MLDVRLTDAAFLTMDPARPVAREVGVWRGRVVGVDDEIAGLPAARTVGLAGATVLPGFVDAHVHLAWAGLREATPVVDPARGVDAVLATIRDAAAARPEGAWVDVAGYDQRPLGRHLTAAEIDAVSVGRKVFVVHDSGHACVLNSAALAELPAGTRHDDGVLAEQGMAAARAVRQPYGAAELAAAIGRAARTCVSEGVTAVAEAGIGGGLISHSPIELAAWQLAVEAGLPTRAQVMVAAVALRDVAAHADDDTPRAIDLGLRTGLGGDRLGIGALKVFTDGGMMARTAALTSPYLGPAGPAGDAGELFAPYEVIAAQVLAGHVAGWQLAVHAIGDRAVDAALDAIEAAQRVRPRRDARHRIEHAGLVRPDQLARFAELDVTAVVQPNFLWYLGDDYAEIMGPERAPWLYRGQAFLDAGVALAGSSDRPVTVGAPLRSIQFMTTRATSSGLLVGPDEVMTVDAALRAFTVDAARACRWERDLGSITAGACADLVVLGDDPRRVEPSAIGDIEVVATISGGDVVHGTLT